MVAGGGVLSCPVLSSGGVGSGGAGGCRESERLGAWERLERAFPALSRILREPEGAWPQGGPGRPRDRANRSPEPGQTGARNSLYIGVFRAFSGSAKNQSFVSDNMPYKAFRGRITPKFDNSL